jgi:hypothetical protein
MIFESFANLIDYFLPLIIFLSLLLFAFLIGMGLSSFLDYLRMEPIIKEMDRNVWTKLQRQNRKFNQEKNILISWTKSNKQIFWLNLFFFNFFPWRNILYWTYLGVVPFMIPLNANILVYPRTLWYQNTRYFRDMVEFLNNTCFLRLFRLSAFTDS